MPSSTSDDGDLKVQVLGHDERPSLWQRLCCFCVSTTAHADESVATRSVEIATVHLEDEATTAVARTPDTTYQPLVVSKELLGEGATSKVYEATFRETPGSDPLEVAAKVVIKAGMSAEEVQWIREEIELHSQLAHRNVCKLHTIVETPETITLVLQICYGGSLVDTMVEAAEDGLPLDENFVRTSFVQLLEGLLYLQTQYVCEGPPTQLHLGSSTRTRALIAARRLLCLACTAGA